MKTITITINIPEDADIRLAEYAINTAILKTAKKLHLPQEKLGPSAADLTCDKCHQEFATRRHAGQHKRWCDGSGQDVRSETKQAKKWAKALVGPPPGPATPGKIARITPAIGEKISDCCQSIVTTGAEAPHPKTRIVGKTYCVLCGIRCLWKKYDPNPKKKSGRPAKKKKADPFMPNNFSDDSTSFS